jgi:hypothetical protein
LSNLETIIKDLNSSGFWISNLFQTQDGLWQANLAKLFPFGRASFEFGLGRNPTEALLKAWERVYDKPSEVVPAELPAEFKPKTKPSLDIDKLLEGL